MDKTFDGEKKWKNVQGSRTKGKKWDASTGGVQKNAEAFQAGFTSSPRETLWSAIDILTGKGKKPKK